LIGGIHWRWLHGGYTVQNPVLVATQWLHEAPIEKAHYRFDSGLSLLYLVAWGGIEPPTQGFSILCSTD
jgi:hypothetical protein